MKNFTLFLFTCLLILNQKSFAQPGSIDSTFSHNGKVTALFAIGRSSANSVAVQPDGKIVVAGENYSDGQYDICLARYNADGTLDSSFGVDGQRVTDLHSDEGANAVAIQADEKIVVAGYWWNGITDTGSRVHFVLIRYMQNGKLDRNFGENGVMTTDFGTDSEVYSLAIQSNGKIIAAGYTASDTLDDYTFALARYNQNGQPDSSFGAEGKVITDLGLISTRGYDVAIQSNGKIIVAGRISNHQSLVDFVLIRYKPDGQVDSSFGTLGKVTTDFGSYDWAKSIAIQPDGRIVVAGTTSASATSYTAFALAQYKPNGNLDSAFGTNGKVITDLEISHQESSALELQADGKILLAGTSNHNFTLMRYWRNGRPDKSFGIKGVVITDVGNGRGECNALAVQPDGKMVVAGYSGSKYIILRYNGDNTFVSKTGSSNFSNSQKQNNLSENFHPAPNPVKDILHIEGLSSYSKTISVIDAKGKLLQQVITGNSSYSFSVKQLSAGIYFIRIDEGDEVSTVKFVKE